MSNSQRPRPPQIGETFAYSSNREMFPILACFSPRVRCTAVNANVALHGQMRNRQTGELESYLQATWQIAGTPRATAKASILVTAEDAEAVLAELSAHVGRAFGPESLKHLCGLLIGLHENYHSGWFTFEAAAHLDRLGYKLRRVGKNCYHHGGNVTKARTIVGLLSSLPIQISYRTTTGRQSVTVRLFARGSATSPGENDAVSWRDATPPRARGILRPVKDGECILANPWWHSGVHQSGSGEMGCRYTRQLKTLAREDARQHGITLILGVLFPIKFRMNRCQPVRVGARNLMEWTGLNPEGRKRAEHLRKLKAELDYMAQAGYIGSWCVNGESAPLDAVVRISPPEWLSDHFRSCRRGRRRRE